MVRVGEAVFRVPSSVLRQLLAARERQEQRQVGRAATKAKVTQASGGDDDDAGGGKQDEQERWYEELLALLQDVADNEDLESEEARIVLPDE